MNICQVLRRSSVRCFMLIYLEKKMPFYCCHDLCASEWNVFLLLGGPIKRSASAEVKGGKMFSFSHMQHLSILSREEEKWRRNSWISASARGQRSSNQTGPPLRKKPGVKISTYLYSVGKGSPSPNSTRLHHEPQSIHTHNFRTGPLLTITFYIY